MPPKLTTDLGRILVNLLAEMYNIILPPCRFQFALLASAITIDSPWGLCSEQPEVENLLLKTFEEQMSIC